METGESLLNKEKRINKRLVPLLVVGSLTGMATYLYESFSDTQAEWQQWAWVVHAIVGIALTIQLVPYIMVHAQRTLAFRRWWLVASGVMMLLCLIIFMVTGSLLIFAGQTEQTLWIIQLHIYASFAFITFTAFHLVHHGIKIFSWQQAKPFISLPSGLSRVLLLSLCSGFIATLVLAGFERVIKTPYSVEAVVADYELPYGQHPFRPSQTETWHGLFVDPRQIANSENCATCHPQIFAEWRSSMHKHAASDKTYVTNVSLLAEQKGIAAIRYCEGCHSPVALLTGQLTKGGDHGGIENTPANFEGVGCMGCHGISEVVHLDGVASYLFEPGKDYLFDGVDNALTNSIRNLLIRLKPDQHKQDLARAVIASPEVCATCHAQFMDKDMNNWGWVKMQDDYAAWLNSPYSQQHQEVFSSAAVRRCHDCHMPLVDSSDPSANEQGKHRSHRFPAANTVIPLITGDSEQLAITKRFLQNNKMRISIEAPRRQDATQDQLALDQAIRTDNQTPYYWYLGEAVSLKVIVSNIGVGHNFPGGTLDLNEAWVAVTVIDASSQVVYQTGELMNDGNVDPNAHFYRSLPTDRQGNLVWKHDLFNRVGEAYKDFVPAGESDILTVQFNIPAWAKGPLTISAALKYRKFNQRYAQWALKDLYQPIPVIDVARSALAVPLKIRPELERKLTFVQQE